jgi:hypothetical protein
MRRVCVVAGAREASPAAGVSSFPNGSFSTAFRRLDAEKTRHRPAPSPKRASAACNLRCFNDAHVILRKTFVYSHHLTGHDFGTMELDGRTFI